MYDETLNFRREVGWDDRNFRWISLKSRRVQIGIAILDFFIMPIYNNYLNYFTVLTVIYIIFWLFYFKIVN